MVQTAQETALPLKTILTYFDIAKTGGSPRLTDAFLVLFCLKFVQNGLFLQYPFRVRGPWGPYLLHPEGSHPHS